MRPEVRRRSGMGIRWPHLSRAGVVRELVDKWRGMSAALRSFPAGSGSSWDGDGSWKIKQIRPQQFECILPARPAHNWPAHIRICVPLDCRPRLASRLRAADVIAPHTCAVQSWDAKLACARKQLRISTFQLFDSF